MVDTPTIETMIIIATFVNIIIFLSLLLVVVFVYFTSVHLLRTGFELISMLSPFVCDCKITAFCVRTQLFHDNSSLFYDLVDIPQPNP